MNRAQLEHLIGAAASVAGDDEIVVIGSQSVLGRFPDAPAELLVSSEADLHPCIHEDRTDLVDGTLGEGSPFHRTFGYYAQGVDPTTSLLPDGWQSRLIPVRARRSRRATGWCLEIHDLSISKLAAGREKDLEFAAAAARHGLTHGDLLRARLAATKSVRESSRPLPRGSPVSSDRHESKSDSPTARRLGMMSAPCSNAS
jgi:hypothetical protein